MQSFSCYDSGSSLLRGAISTLSTFSYFNTIRDSFGPEADPDISCVSTFVPESSGIIKDDENFVFVKDGMAILDACNFASESNENIIDYFMEVQRSYPEYKLRVVRGEFPLFVSRGYSFYYDRSGKLAHTSLPEVEYSTHLLCIENYKDHISYSSKIMK